MAGSQDDDLDVKPRGSARGLLAFALVLALLVFLIDTQVPLGLVILLGYLPLLLVLVKWGGPRQYWLLALAASGLIVAGYFITPPEPLFKWMEVHNRALGIAAIWTASTIGSLLWSTRFRLAEQHERYSRTLGSIGDAVIATDASGAITFMNPVAETLTGWRLFVARGQDIAQVFHVVVEPSRQPATNPVERVLTTGQTVELSNHVVLISHDGTEYPIDDCAAPIRDRNGQIAGVVLVFRDMSAKRRAEQKLKELLAQSEAREAELAAIFDSLHQPVLVFDDLGKPVRANPAAHEILAADPCALNADSYLQLSNMFGTRRMDGTPVQAADLPSRRALLGETVKGERMMLTNAKGREVIFEAAGMPLRVADRLVGAVAVWNDITERTHIEHEREQLLASERAARCEAERANRIKDEFVSTLSHELRTPLNAILGWAQMLRRTHAGPQDIEEALEVIQSNALAQKQLIEDLLDVSRMMSGKVRLTLRPLDVNRAAADALASIRPTAAEKGLRIEESLEPNAGCILADAERMQQILWNLLSNAVKFTPAGGKVRFTLERNGGRVVLSVTDSGIGIRPDFLPYLFERFRQADASTTRRFRGLGLGLSIVKQLVEMHGGTVAAASGGENQGATFTVELPLTSQTVATCPATTGGSRTGENGELETKLEGLRVLIVDDLPDARELLSRLFREYAAAPVAVDSAAAALEQIHSAPPDILVSDISMPDEDGYSLIQRVRALPAERLARIPAIAVTALARPEDRNHAIRAGFQAHVAKPVDPAELIALVAGLAGRTPRRKKDRPSSAAT